LHPHPALTSIYYDPPIPSTLEEVAMIQPTKIEIVDLLSQEIYGVPLIESLSTERAAVFSAIYQLMSPAPPKYLNYPPTNRPAFLLLNKRALTRRTDLAEFRTLHAEHVVWPVIYPEPSELPILLHNVSTWIASWTEYLSGGTTGECDNARDFAVGVIAKVVQIHPFTNGNKRTARELAAAVTAKLGCSWEEYDFSRLDIRRQYYQFRFTKALWRRDYVALKRLHRKYRQNSNAVKGGSAWRSKVQLYDNIFLLGGANSKNEDI
jgi:hypothetical protein